MCKGEQKMPPYGYSETRFEPPAETDVKLEPGETKIVNVNGTVKIELYADVEHRIHTKILHKKTVVQFVEDRSSQD